MASATGSLVALPPDILRLLLTDPGDYHAIWQVCTGLATVTPAEFELWNKLRNLVEGFYAQGKSGQWRLAQVEAARNGDLVMLRWCRNMPRCMHDCTRSRRR